MARPFTLYKFRSMVKDAEAPGEGAVGEKGATRRASAQ
jgi:lipopolysaccharide/colanic/teichoic acid biosynthesis glycosyltransferase